VCQICVILAGSVVERAHSCLIIVETCCCWQRLARALHRPALRCVPFLLLVLVLKLHGVPGTFLGTRGQLLGQLGTDELSLLLPAARRGLRLLLHQFDELQPNHVGMNRVASPRQCSLLPPAGNLQVRACSTCLRLTLTS
jgi:hypothetical protein